MKCPICGKEISKTVDFKNKFVPYYECDICGKFYIEPPFMNKLEGFLARYGEEKYRELLNLMQRKTKEQLVAFVHDFEEPIVNVDEAIYLEILDLTNELKIFVEDLNCNEYGD